MDMKPVNMSMQAGATPLRTLEQLKMNDEGKVEVHGSTDKVDIQPKPKKSALEKTLTAGTKTLCAGWGLGSGIVGGGVGGAAVVGGVDAAANLINGSFEISKVASAAGIGGVAGAAIFGVAGALGGYWIAEKIVAGSKALINLVLRKNPMTPEQDAALQAIKSAEDDPKEAKKAFNHILKGMTTTEDIQQESALYVGLLNHFSNKDYDSSLSAYDAFKKFLPPGEERQVALDELGRFSQSTKSPKEAMDALYIVMSNLQANESIPQECDNLRAVGNALKKCSASHADITPSVSGEAYALLKAGFAPEERGDALNALMGKFSELRSEPGDVMENMKAVISNRQQGDDVAAEAATLVGLIGKAGGNGETARLAYATTKSDFPATERAEALKQFFALCETEKSPAEAASTLKTLHKGINTGETLGDQVSFYNELRGLFGESKKPQASAMAAYDAVKTCFKPGERKEALVQLKNLIAAEKAVGEDVGAAGGDLKFLYTHMSKGEKFGEQMDVFISDLKAKGSSAGAQRKYVDDKFKELYK